MRGRLAVAVALYAPTHVEYDIDNRMKGLLDALTEAGVWQDDKQIDRLSIERGEVIKGGACSLLVETMAAVRAVGATA